MSTRPDLASFSLTVPLDASGIPDFKPDQPLRVLAVAADGTARSTEVRLDARGHGVANFAFEKPPGALRVLVGPADASDEDLQGLQTLAVRVPARRWREQPQVKLQPLLIPPFFWWWWRRWCRTYTVRGRVLCPDGRPAPGARVCAYEVDAWWWWSSRQLVGCDVTDASGAFAITFRHCCGWWPWWWWRLRNWTLEPFLLDRLVPLLQREPRVGPIPLPDPAPDLRVFEQLFGAPEEPLLDGPPAAPVFRLQDKAAALARAAAARVETLASQARMPIAVEALPALRDRLLQRLPLAPELEALRIWPWWPFQPWWDCAPDINFRVTQDCREPGQVIVDEGYGETRWNVPTELDVTLVANSQACCVADEDDDPDGLCALLTNVCDAGINIIGGNPGAPAAPVGYVSPGLVATTGDRPFGGRVLIQGLVGTDVDYYDFQISDDGGATWDDMPGPSVGDIPREYWIPATNTFVTVPFLHEVDGRLVFEGRVHYEATHDPGTWGVTRFWMAANYLSLMNWLTQTPFRNGTYRLRIRGWQLVGGNLQNPQILPTCSLQTPAGLVLRIDNRLEGPGSGHPASVPSHPCGGGTVHTCTLEPDTDILAVRIVHADPLQPPSLIGACGAQQLQAGDLLEIDFFAHDPEGHLAYYSLQATYGENLARNLLGLPGMTLTPLGGAPVPAAAQVGPAYTAARLDGAVAPAWNGGAIRLRVAASEAFPETCCYQLELRAHKRTIVGCSYSLWNHTNYSEYSFLVSV